jgi:hypothetical protein
LEFPRVLADEEWQLDAVLEREGGLEGACERVEAGPCCRRGN